MGRVTIFYPETGKTNELNPLGIVKWNYKWGCWGILWDNSDFIDPVFLLNELDSIYIVGSYTDGWIEEKDPLFSGMEK